MKRYGSLVILGVLAASCASKEKPEPNYQKPTAYAPQELPRVRESSLSSTSAIVESIDHGTRMITLRGPYGVRSNFKVSDRVRNLDQIQVADKVVVDYYQSMAIQVVLPGTAVDQKETIVDQAEPGESPEGSVTTITTMVATIEAIDPSFPSITLSDNKGNFRTVWVRHPDRLKLVKVGDILKITYAEAVAVSVKPMAPSPAPPH